MSAQARIQSLKSEIARGREVMERIERYYDQRAGTLTPGPSGTDNAIVLSEILTNFSTCAETIFVRISQFFENSLYDWERLDFVRYKFERARSRLPGELDDFVAFLNRLLADEVD